MCFVMFIEIIITPFAMREFSIFKFSGYNLKKKIEKDPLEIHSKL